MSEVKVFGVVGAGQMGRGIAQVAAQTGMQVMLLDAKDEWAKAGKDRIAKGLDRLIQKERLTQADADALLARITPTSDYGDFADADMVVEAATEDLSVKEEIFRNADAAMTKASGILASNTSSISLTKLAAATKRPEQVIGMHFMNPVPVMKLVELVRALQTSDETFATTEKVGQAMGKVLVSTKDMPGFIVNRMLIPFLNEGCFALQEGLGTVEDIDLATKLGLNHPMGPFELADLIGLDTVLYIGEVLHREFGDDKYRPPATLRNYVAAGWLGRKTGRGFYVYGDDGPAENPDVAGLIDTARKDAGVTPRDFTDEEIVARYMAAMVNEAARVVGEGIAKRPLAVDAVKLFGYGFPRYRGGPMKYADMTGIATIRDRIRGYAKDNPEFWQVAPLLDELAEKDSKFEDRNT